MGKINYAPLEWSSETDQAIFLEYCEEAAKRLVEWNLVQEAPDLLDGDIGHMLWAASGGCIGVVSRLLEAAVLHALKRDGKTVEFEDLALAVDTRGIPNNMSTYNPFREGVRKAQVDKAA
jgi:hypothetical protein